MDKSNLPNKRAIRLKDYDYNSPGTYFITICTKNREEILSHIRVGTGVLDRPQNELTKYGQIASEQLDFMADFYDDIALDKYVIMPNHIHLLLTVKDSLNGRSGTPVPTNSIVAKFISTFKRFSNKKCGYNIWQERFYDHIIRNQADYNEKWEYIEYNPLKWEQDHLYQK